jgi:hypothetical protein
MAKATKIWVCTVPLSYEYTTYGATELEAKQTMVKLLNKYRDGRHTIKKVEALMEFYGGSCGEVESGQGYRR